MEGRREGGSEEEGKGRAAGEGDLRRKREGHHETHPEEEMEEEKAEDEEHRVVSRSASRFCLPGQGGGQGEGGGGGRRRPGRRRWLEGRPDGASKDARSARRREASTR
eukprot:4878398-Pyramimonas_sp.AAC.1